MDITSLTNRPQSTPPPTLSQQSDWYPAPTTLHIVDEDQTSSQSSTASSGYPINYGSLPRSHSHSTFIQHTSVPPRSYAATPPQNTFQHHYSPGQHSRSTTSPKAQQGNQSRPHHQPLVRGYSTGVLQSDYPIHGQRITHQDGRSQTLNRNLPSYPAGKHPYPAGESNAPPSLPPKGIGTASSSAGQHSNNRTAQWDFSDSRGQGSQPDSSRPYQHSRPTSAPKKSGLYHHQAQARPNAAPIQGVEQPQTQPFTAHSSYPHALPHHPTHRTANGSRVAHWKRHTISGGHSSPHTNSSHNSLQRRESSYEVECIQETPNHKLESSVRKVRSLQHLSHGGASVTDYPATHSRKILTVVDQQGLESQMPEHVTLSNYKPPHREIPHREHVRVKKQHMYEQVELPIAEEQNDVVGHRTDLHPQEVEGLVTSVKRSNRWSPGLPKHLVAKQIGRRRSVPSAGIMGTGASLQYLPDRAGLRYLDTVSLQDCDLERSAQTKPVNEGEATGGEGTTGDASAGKKTAGSRGKPANTVMMKLAKKFSKKNLPISRDDGDGSSIGGDSLEKGEGTSKMKHRSNSVSNLDSLEGFGRRSQSMEHLGPKSVNGSRSGSVGASSTPQGSPRMVRSWSRGKINRRSTDMDSDSAVSSIHRVGSRGLTGDPDDSLFEAIEQGNYDAVASLIDADLVTKFNMLNEDEFLAVDLSVMLGHHNITQLLLKIGAKDSPKFCRDPSSRASRINSLISEAERNLYRVKENFTSLSASSGVKDVEKRYKRGERRLHLYKIMLRNYNVATLPGPPTNVQLQITSSRSLMVTFSEPQQQRNNATITRYKIEWCTSEDFKPVVGDFVLTDLRSMEYIIPDLDNGERYFVRVSAYNMKGFGVTVKSSPPSAMPSSWHDLNNSRPRFEGCTDKMHVLSAQFANAVSFAPNALSKPKSSSRKPNPRIRKSGSAVKFNKVLKPGVFLASLVYSEDTKILVTNDDIIPIVEVSQAMSASIGADFVWLSSLSCTWEQVQDMCDLSDEYTSSPSVQFRNKLLHAVLDLQHALGISDIGRLHPVPYKDLHGAIVFVAVQYTMDTKPVAAGNSSLKWSDMSKLWRRRATPAKGVGLEAFPVPEQLVLDAQEMIAHHHTSARPLEKGLYLGYLKARSSVASMKVVCSREYPNVLPHLKIRDNSNLSTEEWEWVKSLQSPGDVPSSLLTNSQHLQNTLLPNILLFLKNLGFSKEEADTHQLYVHEAIELNEQTTLLLVLPPHDLVCTAPGSTDHFVEMPDFVAMPINNFEIMQLYTYQRAFMTKFSMVSSRLDVELLTTHQQLREAFSNTEVAEAKQKKSLLDNFNTRTEQTWKQMRWIEDAVQKGRDHQAGFNTLLPLSLFRQNVERQMKEIARLQQEEKKKEEALPIPLQQNRAADGGVAEVLLGGYLHVIPSYRTGLSRGTNVKLYIEAVTTTHEVIGLVVDQVVKATGGPIVVDYSDFYLVAMVGTREWILQSDYHPLQLQVNPAEMGKVFLSLKRRSEENQLNQMITSV